MCGCALSLVSLFESACPPTWLCGSISIFPLGCFDFFMLVEETSSKCECDDFLAAVFGFVLDLIALFRVDGSFCWFIRFCCLRRGVFLTKWFKERVIVFGDCDLFA